jgi:hypothetical protein
LRDVHFCSTSDPQDPPMNAAAEPPIHLATYAGVLSRSTPGPLKLHAETQTIWWFCPRAVSAYSA